MGLTKFSTLGFLLEMCVILLLSASKPKMHSIYSYCIIFFLSGFIMSMQLNDSDEHSPGNRVMENSARRTALKAGSTENG